MSMTITILLFHSTFSPQSVLVIRHHIAHWCHQTSVILSPFHTWGKNADVPLLFCAIVPHSMLRKKCFALPWNEPDALDTAAP